MPKNLNLPKADFPPFGLDLEEYRDKHGLTYVELAKVIDVLQDRQARAYCLGEKWPRGIQLAKILSATKGEVSLYAMLRRWMRHHNGIPPADGEQPTKAGRLSCRVAGAAAITEFS